MFTYSLSQLRLDIAPSASACEAPLPTPSYLPHHGHFRTQSRPIAGYNVHLDSAVGQISWSNQISPTKAEQPSHEASNIERELVVATE